MARLRHFAVGVLLGVFLPAAGAGEQGLGVDLPAISGVQAGLCVLLERSDGGAAADLARGGKFLVHDLLPDAAAVTAARKRTAEEGLAEFVSVELWTLPGLPYEKNHVNLLVAEDFPALAAKGLSVGEVARALTPYGVACLGGLPAADRPKLEAALKEVGIAQFRREEKGRTWLVLQKPRPKEMGDWTHFAHGADGNRVANDTYLAVPKQIQWIAGPVRFDTLSSSGPMTPANDYVSQWRVAGGRIFYFFRKLLVDRRCGKGK